MDSSINPFTGTANGPNSHSNFLANKNSSRNEAVIMGGVMIGAIVFVVLVGVGCMFYRQRARNMKAQQSKDVDNDGRVSLRRFKTTADGANCGME
ncbi:unnamed protein product [Fusarium graminearum]|uniref:Uncharacterized protein n=1 Tax=Gibberella zeae TaxID=5518 RepID=A0A4U9FCE2_GIBZA|nr:hypothetical protein HG531_001694 [Fusarium graminearum]CAF3601987.1 unnamed protein product [Fusarium graminearum]CAG1963173.1 unnamed protein product [Fusarium graminearum]CAG1971669.1 unnamed protein product [Fusarium graminearum]CAG1972580.1 unnamed protein product [Fusarium graminearum]